MKRRHFLLFLGSLTVATLETQVFTARANKELKFQPVRGPIPMPSDSIEVAQQASIYSRYDIKDDLVLPEEFTYDVIAAWGDPVGESHFGYNNDYLSFIPTGQSEGYLSINFEYVSGRPWLQTYEAVLGKSLPIEAVLAQADDGGLVEINAYNLPENDLKSNIRKICEAALIDQGLGVISLRQTSEGRWQRTNSKADRRITGVSGLTDQRYLKSTGPARAVFLKEDGQGYVDGLGDRIIGSFGNCAGGTTPWGTVLSAEENFQSQVPEPVHADGTSFPPETVPFIFGQTTIVGQGNVFGLAGNKYGWIVEVDPANPEDYGTKHTWLGRYRHEAVGVRVEKNQPLAFYSGCDRKGGHLYKFVSRKAITDPQDKSNSQLFNDGTLYAAKFYPDGTGQWIPLQADTPVEPDFPSQIGGVLTLPDRLQGGFTGGFTIVTEDEAITTFKQQYSTLADLYSGTKEEQQGAILIDAHYAANACGATGTARPEDTEIAPDGSLYIAFTSGNADKEGGPDPRIFRSSRREISEYGCIMHLTEDNNSPTASKFRWEMFAMGGEAALGGAGFANPDNLLIDTKGNIWMVTDMPSGVLNQAVLRRTNEQGEAIKASDLIGLFGNNAIWYLPTSGQSAGKAHLFGMGPMECELTGPCFSEDESTLFLSVQHPGETNGMRQDQAQEERTYAIQTTKGKTFNQSRIVPVGSNWPSGSVNAPPKPAVVAILHQDQHHFT